MVHSGYRQVGGESFSVEAEVVGLRKLGLEVELHQVDAPDRATLGHLAQSMTYSPEATTRLLEKVDQFAPQVVHVQNTFPWLGNAPFVAARRRRVPVVQSLRNYRRSCVSANHFRDALPCYDCSQAFSAWRGVVRGCYRGSPVQSLGVAVQDGVLRGAQKLGVARAAAVYICLSDAMRPIVEPTLPQGSCLVVKYNTLTDVASTAGPGGDELVFVGRLAPEKGIQLLVDAWLSSASRPPLKIIGDGPLEGYVRGFAEKHESVSYLGRRSNAQTLDTVGRARALLALPTWDEPFGRTVMESLAVGTPVLGTNRGAVPELVGQAGWIVEPDVQSLSQQISTLADPRTGVGLRGVARDRFESEFAPDVLSRQLAEIYELAISRSWDGAAA
ncbi:glycosyltransferase [Blastococcus mobilis]